MSASRAGNRKRGRPLLHEPRREGRRSLSVTGWLLATFLLSTQAMMITTPWSFSRRAKPAQLTNRPTLALSLRTGRALHRAMPSSHLKATLRPTTEGYGQTFVWAARPTSSAGESPGHTPGPREFKFSLGTRGGASFYRRPPHPLPLSFFVLRLQRIGWGLLGARIRLSPSK